MSIEIEKYRGIIRNRSIANKLLSYASKNNGPIIHECFCDIENITKYVEVFWDWYDNK